MERLRVDGKFLRTGSRRIFLRMVTYGPFPDGYPDDLATDFARIRTAGFGALRLYSWPERSFLDAAANAGLRVFAGLEWDHGVDFLRRGSLASARTSMSSGLATGSGHPALAGVFIANEVPADLARWMGPIRVREALEDLIAEGKRSAPELIWCYGNYPATEYLEPGNADLTAMNIYLEHEDDFRAYLRRLHHIAGDRPVLISEFGLDSRRNGLEAQATTLAWGLEAARDLGTAGMAIFAWSDRWFATRDVLDWDFGLTDRNGEDKPALAAVRDMPTESAETPTSPSFSVIVCTRNGVGRIGACIRALQGLQQVDYEMIVVDDGSEDGTPDLLEKEFPEVRLIRIEASGLSAARNAGAGAAKGEILAFTDDDCEPDPEWLAELARLFAGEWDAAGGPNLPPRPENALAAVVAAAPGAASHVMLDDLEAEHVPGCNLAVRRSAFFEVGGFDDAFRTAGDDVDFCWRLRDAGFRIGFSPTAFVWHHRRATIPGYLSQQTGYGRAEALLMTKHPNRFSPSGDAMWHGTIYTGGPVRVAGETVIYHGSMGMAGYQGVTARMQPLRELDERFEKPWSRRLLRGITWLAPRLRSFARTGRFRGPLKHEPTPGDPPDSEYGRWSGESREAVIRRLLESGWSAGGPNDAWDVGKDGNRLLIAIEAGRDGSKRTLYRVWGHAESIRELDGATPLEDPADDWPA